MTRPAILPGILLAIGIAQLSDAAELYDSPLPVNLVEVILDSELYSDIPDDFPPIRLPSGFSVVISSTNDLTSSVFLEHQLTPDEAMQRIISSFEQSDWTHLPSPPFAGMTRGGFIAGNDPMSLISIPDRLCHEEHGHLQVQPRSSSFLMLTMNEISQANSTSCSQLIQMEAQAYATSNQGFMRLQEVFPALRLPDEVTRNSGGRGLSGNGTSVSTSQTINIDWSIEQLKQYFSTQLQNLGWVPDSAWSGYYSSGGNWTLTDENQEVFVGTLEVIGGVNNKFDLEFRLRSLSQDQAQGSPGILIGR